jgi:hypothetical protein
MGGFGGRGVGLCVSGPEGRVGVALNFFVGRSGSPRFASAKKLKTLHPYPALRLDAAHGHTPALPAPKVLLFNSGASNVSVWRLICLILRAIGAFLAATVASMSLVREAWTDERLDDLAKRMDDGFDCVDRDLREIRADMKGLDRRLDAMNDSINTRFDAMSSRLDALQRTLLAAASTIAVVIASTLANHL